MCEDLFIPGTPAKGSIFVGEKRKEICDGSCSYSVKKESKVIAVCGSPLMGKTSLLKNIEDKADNQGFLTVFTVATDMKDVWEFFSCLEKQIVESGSKKINEFDGLIEKLKLQQSQSHNLDDIITDLKELKHKCRNVPGIIILIDEADRLNINFDLYIKNVFIENLEGYILIFAFNKPMHPFCINEELDDLTEEERKELIETRALGKTKIDKKSIETLSKFKYPGSSPGNLVLICKILCHEKKKILVESEEELKKVVNALKIYPGWKQKQRSRLELDQMQIGPSWFHATFKRVKTAFKR